MKRLILFAVIALSLSFLLFHASQYLSNSQSKIVMGTTLSLRLDQPFPGLLISSAFKYADKIDALLSKFNPESEISAINHFAGVSAIEVAPETFEVIEKAIDCSKLTQGAFDITLQDYTQVSLNPETKTVKLEKEGMKIDLGGIGKGYLVEKLREYLKSRQVKKALIDMRSSIAVIGGPWMVGVQDPSDKNKILGTIELNDGQSLSTSGNYEQGKHIIDPKTGQYVASCQGVTVLGKDAALADALSTAIFVMGPGKGLVLIRSLPDIECLIVLNDGKIVKTDGFNFQ